VPRPAAAVVEFDEQYHEIGRSYFLPHPNRATAPYDLALDPADNEIWFSGLNAELGRFKPQEKARLKFRVRNSLLVDKR